MEPMGWESLPEDLLLIIFGKLAVEKLPIGAPLACRSWYATSLDASLYKKLDLIPLPKISSSLSGDALTTVQPAAVIRNVVPRGGEGVQRVMLPYRGVSDDNVVYIADRCPSLKFFHIDSLRRISRRTFIYAICKWKNLQGMATDGRFLRHYFLDEIHSKCKNIVYLGVNTKLSDHTAYNIAIFQNPTLKSIDLFNTSITHEDLLLILKGCKELAYLNITGCGDLGLDPEIPKLAAGLKHFKFDN